MNEQEFLSLLIGMVDSGECNDKTSISDSLKRSNIQMDKTTTFSQKGWHVCYENINLISTPEDYKILEPYSAYVESLARIIYPENDESYPYDLNEFKLKPGLVELRRGESGEYFFENYESITINELKKAKYTIWIAMAWFTNKKIYDVLLDKKSEGVNVQIIIDDNENNRKPKFLLENDFETYRIRVESLYKNFMHDKFCVIDFKTVVHGTFNWTEAGNYNKETVAVIPNDYVTAKKFTDEFMQLKLKGMQELRQS